MSKKSTHVSIPFTQTINKLSKESNLIKWIIVNIVKSELAEVC
jgi:hypothetical protein